MLHLIDVTKGMNLEMLENFLSSFNHTNLEVVGLLRETKDIIVYARFWKISHIGVTAFQIDRESPLFEIMSGMIGMTDTVHYVLISKDVHEYIVASYNHLSLFFYEEQKLIPLSIDEMFQVENA